MNSNQDLIKANANIIESDFNWLKNLILYQLGKADGERPHGRSGDGGAATPAE